MGMAWCRVSSLSAAVARALKEELFPASRSRILRAAQGKVVEGWELDYVLGKALTKTKYPGIRAVLSDLDQWLDAQR